MGIERGEGSPQNAGVKSGAVAAGKDEGIAGEGLRIWGDVKFRGDAVIRADVKGSVAGAEKVIVTEGTVVSGVVTGTDLRIEGQAQAGAEARGRLWIGPRAVVKGRCVARAVRIEPGASFRGELQVG